jgi:hypothetical protein
VTECQGCGAWNDTSRTLCVLCGTPLAEIDEWDAAAELPPLPPLPDGGLSASMPSWLREPPVPVIAEALPLAAPDRGVAPEPVADLVPLDPRADPRTFLSDDDFPRWLRDLAARWEGAADPSAESANMRAHARIAPPVTTQTTPDPDSASEFASEPERDPEPDEPAPAERLAKERRGHDVWEMLLLVLLFIGVIAAALWALFANGVLSLGP